MGRDLLLKMFVVPVAILLTLPAFGRLYREIGSPTSRLPRPLLVRGTATLLIAPLALVVLGLAGKLLSFAGTTALLRNQDFLWQASSWLFAAAIPALVAVDAVRAGTWDPVRGLHILGWGLLAWVWAPPLTVLVATRDFLGWDQMVGLYAPLTLVALGCLVAGRWPRRFSRRASS